MNIAQKLIERYESKDFKSDYSQILYESFANNEGDKINRLIDLFNVSNYETQKYLTNWLNIDREQAKKIFDFITENFDEFTASFNGCYVGYTSLESVIINLDKGLHIDLLRSPKLLNDFLLTIKN